MCDLDCAAQGPDGRVWVSGSTSNVPAPVEGATQLDGRSVGFEYGDGLGGVLGRPLRPARGTSDVLEGDVRRADLDRVTDLVPQPQCVLGRREGLVHLIGDHAFGGERVQQLGALSRPGETRRTAVPCGSGAPLPDAPPDQRQLDPPPGRSETRGRPRWRPPHDRPTVRRRRHAAAPARAGWLDSPWPAGSAGFPSAMTDRDNSCRNPSSAPKVINMPCSTQSSMPSASAPLASIRTSGVEPQPQLRGDVQSAAAARRQPRRARKHDVAHRAGRARSGRQAFGDKERVA